MSTEKNNDEKTALHLKKCVLHSVEENVKILEDIFSFKVRQLGRLTASFLRFLNIVHGFLLLFFCRRRLYGYQTPRAVGRE